jgi:hypothetical protein
MVLNSILPVPFAGVHRNLRRRARSGWDEDSGAAAAERV